VMNDIEGVVRTIVLTLKPKPHS